MSFRDSELKRPRQEPIRTLLKEAIAIFSEQLSSPWRHPGVLRGHDEALENAAHSRSDHTARIFLSAGYAAWLAFFITTCPTADLSVPCTRQPAKMLVVNGFRSCAVEDRAHVAQMVARTSLHPTVQSFVDNTLKGDKRHRFATAGEESSSSNRASALHRLHQRFGVLGHAVDQIFTNASVPALISILPETLRGIVRIASIRRGDKLYQKATVTMGFTNDEEDDCIMSIGIRSDKVEGLASTLFNMRFETDVMEQGRRATPDAHAAGRAVGGHATNGNVMNSGVIDNDRFFAGYLSAAIKASKAYLKNSAEARCILMVIPRDPEDDAYINFFLGVRTDADHYVDAIHEAPGGLEPIDWLFASLVHWTTPALRKFW
ncbi:hypothetical protein HJFPF1_05564 [Paramyrothecium foliicola]|nr:hypothetical protein HJFPF1_05564 [Paramyrothecium foliicola]